MGLKIKQQALESLLVGVLIFPPAKVSNMPGTTDIDGPGQIRLLHQLIQRDGEQHQFVLLLFLLKSSHNFFLNPFAVDRMFREDYQELIVQTNRLINIVPKILTDLQVLRSKPTTHAVALQVSIQPFSKVLVLASIANKAGVVLDRMGHQRTHGDDEVLWNTSSAQKDLRNMACGAVDGINANRRWIAMLHCLKPFHSTQINVIELCPSYFRAADLSIPEVRTTEIGATQVSIAEVGSSEAGTTEVGIAEVGMVKVCIAAVGNTEICTCEVGIAEVGTTKVSITEVSIAQIGITKIGIPEIGTPQVSTAEISTLQIRTPQVIMAEVGLAQVRVYLCMLLPPCIPNVPSLPEQVKLLLIYQVAHLLLVLTL